MRKNSQGFITTIILIVLALVLVAAVYYYGHSQTKISINPKITLVPESSALPTPDPTANWRQITNKYWSFKSPSNLHYILCEPEEGLILLDSTMIKSDQKVECAFDTVYLISISRETSVYPIPTNTDVIPTTDPKSPVGDASNLYTLVSDKKNIQIDGRTAIYQKEVQHGGQGGGTYIRAFVVDGAVTYIFTLSDVSQQKIFDQILSTFSFSK